MQTPRTDLCRHPAPTCADTLHYTAPLHTVVREGCIPCMIDAISLSQRVSFDTAVATLAASAARRGCADVDSLFYTAWRFQHGRT